MCYNRSYEHKILDQLEFNKVKTSSQNTCRLNRLRRVTTGAYDQSRKNSKSIYENQEMAEIFVEHHGFAIGSLRDISEPLRRLELDADLNIQELLLSRRCCSFC
ncbi:MAG: hypothetical protein ACLS36_01375 [Streptococcus sp.]